MAMPSYFKNNYKGRSELMYRVSADRFSTSAVDDIRAFVVRALRSLVRWWRERGRHLASATMLSFAHRLRLNLTYHRMVSFPHMLVAIWVVVLLWGERWVFHSKVESCRWSNWENWPAGAEPHRVALIADPQLIDPHTYPGRPWPLNDLTILITDNYLRRSYSQLQQQLNPDSTFFLGDLFDGGREWKTEHGKFDDPEWAAKHPKNEQKYLNQWQKSYGEWFWLKEYARFGDIFLNPWIKSGVETSRRRKLVASLPGNHDLGFGAGVKVAVRNRFETYFGETNRVDVIGNHTFVSVDTVSMSAASSDRAAQHDLKEIYEPVERFLDNVKEIKQKAVDRELRFLRGETQQDAVKHKIEELDKARFDDKPSLGANAPELPTILLTHVPLYRNPGTPCGPLRERWPPTKPPKGQTEPVFPDHRNAISVSAGYQYQNVLSQQDSEKLVSKVGNVVHAFSGDDHDYCEVRHLMGGGAQPQRPVREITVKSMSMAMGVTKPGFLLVSLYNPINPADGRPMTTAASAAETTPPTTLQTHLCLLPSQLSTYLRYATLALVSLVVLAARAFLVPLLGLRPFALDPAAEMQQQQQTRRSVSILPVFKAKVEDYDEYALPPDRHHQRGLSKSSGNGNGDGSGATARTRERGGSLGGGGIQGVRMDGLVGQARNVSPKGSYGHDLKNSHLDNKDGAGHGRRTSHAGGRKWGWGGGGSGRARAPPRIEIASEDDEEDGYAGGKWKARRRIGGRPKGMVRVALRELWTTVWRVAWMVLCFFAWLAWKG
ncbi:hypothetical protein VTK26DRAFT_8001 [Humicola hyalothermophila]